MGANGSVLGASRGPERLVGDGRGRYVDYEHGSIYWSSGTGAHAVVGAARSAWLAAGGPRGALGYPRGERVHDEAGAWVQQFEKGVLGDTPHSATSVLYGVPYSRWRRLGAQTGVLGHPTSNRLTRDGGRWVQWFAERRHGRHAGQRHRVPDRRDLSRAGVSWGGRRHPGLPRGGRASGG